MHDDLHRIPWATNGWDQIIPGLYQGGHYKEGAHLTEQRVVVGTEFDRVYSYYQADDYHGPSLTIPRVYLRIPDGQLSAFELLEVASHAQEMARFVAMGARVLVRCQAGYNRSGLVVGLTLWYLGYRDVQENIDLIKRQRSRWALSNEHFRNYLHLWAETGR